MQRTLGCFPQRARPGRIDADRGLECRRAVHRQERPLGHRLGCIPPRIQRSDDLVIIQITANDTRTIEQKKALYAAIAGKLSRDPGLDPADIFINLVEVMWENWSFGNGEAQYMDQ